MTRPIVNPEVTKIALRLQQVLDQSKFQNTRIAIVVLAERGDPKHTIIEVRPIEPKAGNLDFLLSLLEISPDIGPEIRVVYKENGAGE